MSAQAPQRPTLSLRPAPQGTEAEAAPAPARSTSSRWRISHTLWKRARAAYAIGRDTPPTGNETSLWLRSVLLGAIVNRERSAGAPQQRLAIVVPAGTGDRYAPIAQAQGYESVSAWAYDVLETAAAKAEAGEGISSP